ncbi:unnamed protein product [Gadus morhua 'NCC']
MGDLQGNQLQNEDGDSPSPQTMSPSDWGGTATDPMESTCFMNNNHNTGIQCAGSAVFRVILCQSIFPGARWRAIDSLYPSVYMERSCSTAWHFRKHPSLTDTADWYSDDSFVRSLRAHRGAPWVIAGDKLSSYWSAHVRPAVLPTVPTDSCLLQALAGLESYMMWVQRVTPPHT